MVLAHTTGEIVLILLAVAIGGFTVGLGFVTGTYVIRRFRCYIKDETNGH